MAVQISNSLIFVLWAMHAAVHDTVMCHQRKELWANSVSLLMTLVLEFTTFCVRRFVISTTLFQALR